MDAPKVGDRVRFTSLNMAMTQEEYDEWHSKTRIDPGNEGVVVETPIPGNWPVQVNYTNSEGAEVYMTTFDGMVEPVQ